MGYLVHVGATVMCAHAGQAQPMVPNLRVKVGNQQIVTQSTSYTVAGCTLPSPPTANGPCVTAQWTIAAMRVKVGGSPVILQDSQATCTPTGSPLTVFVTQTRVKGT
jgi:hypothetical protein